MIGTDEGFNQYQLATNQIKWMESDKGKNHGWIEIKGSVHNKYIRANEEANKGNLVLAGIKDSDNVYGHISIVRPSNRTNSLIVRDGPDTIASSKINSRGVFLKEDFLFNQKSMEIYEKDIQIFYNENI